MQIALESAKNSGAARHGSSLRLEEQRDNTGEREFREDMVFPTLNFPSDHAIVSVLCTRFARAAVTGSMGGTGSGLANAASPASVAPPGASAEGCGCCHMRLLSCSRPRAKVPSARSLPSPSWLRKPSRAEAPKL